MTFTRRVGKKKPIKERELLVQREIARVAETLPRLVPRVLVFAKLVARGLSIAKISKSQGISEASVKQYISRVYGGLQMYYMKNSHLRRKVLKAAYRKYRENTKKDRS